MMKRLLFVLLIMGVIGVCYAVVGTPPSNEQIVKEFNLPPEPDPVKNKETIEGIVDKDLVRVDVKRAITFKHYPDKQKIHLMNLLAANSTKEIRAYEGFVKAKSSKEKAKYRKMYLGTVDEYTELIACLSTYYDEGFFDLSKEVRNLQNNTRDRKIHARMRGVLAPAVIELPTYEDELKICKKYKIQ